MDSIGTAVSAAVFGLPLGLATAWIVHVLIRRNMFSTPVHFILATFLVAIANSILGAIIATFVSGGGPGSIHGHVDSERCTWPFWRETQLYNSTTPARIAVSTSMVGDTASSLPYMDDW